MDIYSVHDRYSQVSRTLPGALTPAHTRPAAVAPALHTTHRRVPAAWQAMVDVLALWIYTSTRQVICRSMPHTEPDLDSSPDSCYY